MAGDLFVGVCSGGVRPDRTMYVPVRSPAPRRDGDHVWPLVDAGPALGDPGSGTGGRFPGRAALEEGGMARRRRGIQPRM